MSENDCPPLTHSLPFSLLRFGTRRIKANQVYQEYIAERHHLHMNATRWMSLTEFVKHLGKEGIVHVDENEQGWFISWVDNSPEALKRQAALQKMERAKMDDEGRERKRLKEQIRSANEARGGEQDSASPQPTQIGLNRDASAGPIRLGIGTSGGGGANKPESSSPPAATQVAASKPSFSISTSTSTSSSAGAASGKPFKANPLKSSANPLKSSAPPPSSSSSSSRAAQPRTMAERIRLEEEERRKRKMTGPMPAANGGGPGGGVKRIRM